MKRLLDCDSSDLVSMTKQDKLNAIYASEGRITIQELSLFSDMQLLEPISDAELACAFGADMILFNAFDVFSPKIPGRLIGINLEPIDEFLDMAIDRKNISMGRIACRETLQKAKELDVDFVVLTGNPSSGVSNDSIINTLNKTRDIFEDSMIMIAGKMHASGSKTETGRNIITKVNIEHLADAGANVILVPAAGTIPGLTLEIVKDFIQDIHDSNLLALTAIGTSQEGADKDTIRQLALMSKMAGADLHHIGDAGVGGMDLENLLAYNIAIKGKRHTYMRMARSVNR
ncbi:MAG: haloacid dehalogenase-like hydrolase [Anaerorhabdus sp.]